MSHPVPPPPPVQDREAPATVGLPRAGRRLAPRERREAIVDAALAVARRKGLGGTTVRDVAAQMGTSSGLIHHYFASMDEVLVAAFERVAAADLAIAQRALADAPDPIEALRRFFGSYAPADADRAFQLWLDAWSEAARRPALRLASRRLNLAWQGTLQATIEAGVTAGVLTSGDPGAAAWRLLSLVDGLALQVVAHRTTIRRRDVQAWTLVAAERELGLRPGALSELGTRRASRRPTATPARGRTPSRPRPSRAGPRPR